MAAVQTDAAQRNAEAVAASTSKFRNGQRRTASSCAWIVRRQKGTGTSSVVSGLVSGDARLDIGAADDAAERLTRRETIDGVLDAGL